MAELALKSLNIENFVFWDNSVQMLETAKQRFQGSNTEFLLASALDLNRIEEFDVITAIQVLHYFHENERSDVISRSYKALSSPGIFISFENFAPYSETGKQILLNRWKKYQLSQGGSPIECDKHIARYGKAYFPITIFWKDGRSFCLETTVKYFLLPRNLFALCGATNLIIKSDQRKRS